MNLQEGATYTYGAAVMMVVAVAERKSCKQVNLFITAKSLYLIK